MNCCPDCFSDPALSNMVKELAGNKEGDCDFCGAHAVPICPVGPEGVLSDRFESLFDVFAPRGEAPEDRVLSKKPQPFLEAFTSTWDIFSNNVSKEKRRRFLNELFGEEEWFRTLQKSEVDVTPKKGGVDLSSLSIFGEGDWSGFSDSIRHQSRFFTTLGNDKVLTDLLSSAQTEWDVNRPLFRARLWNRDEKTAEKDLYEPPSKLASGGRMNSEGIPCLYVADSCKTAVSEIRAGMHDQIAVAKLRPKDPFKYVDLTRLESISPFDEVDCSALVVNQAHLKQISQELSRPIRRFGDRHGNEELEYVPTQYLSELIHSKGNRGIGYASVMRAGGVNLAISCHLPDMFAVERIDIVRVSSLEYQLSASKAPC